MSEMTDTIAGSSSIIKIRAIGERVLGNETISAVRSGKPKVAKTFRYEEGGENLGARGRSGTQLRLREWAFSRVRERPVRTKFRLIAPLTGGWQRPRIAGRWRSNSALTKRDRRVGSEASFSAGF